LAESRLIRLDVPVALTALAVVATLAASSPARGADRDDTDWLQAQLDRGGDVFLPRLANGECYATRGLWVSRDDTSIRSDGACLVALGPGPPRLKTAEGTLLPIAATAVFFLDHSNVNDPLPIGVRISGLRIVVPSAVRMRGIGVFTHEATIDRVTIEGAPTTAVLIGGGKPGSAGMTERITIRDSVLRGAKRAIVSAYGPLRLRVERSVIAGATGTSAPGLEIRAVDRGQPALDVRVAGNAIADNAGPGILVNLEPANGPPVLASGIVLTGNSVWRNGRRAQPALRGGIVLVGGQADGKGEIVLTDNVVSANRGPGLLQRNLRGELRAERNDLRGNRGGSVKGTRAAAAPVPAPATPSVPPAVPAAVARDDTAWLQERLDLGGAIFLPRLPNDECYATRGLWVSRDDTTISSDGACIRSLGPGEVRLRSGDGDAIAASAVFYVNRSRPTDPAPVRIRISNLRIVVPEGQEMYGVAAFGHQVTLTSLDIGGFPKDDVIIGGRGNGNGYAAHVAVLDSTLRGASRNAITAFGVVDLRIEGNTIEGVRDAPPGQPAAGIDLEPDFRGQPTLGVVIRRNTIRDNAGPGILLELDTNTGSALIATAIEVRGNVILRNARKPTPPKRAGLVIAGGEHGLQGTLAIAENVIRENGGPGILATRLKLRVELIANDLGDNDGGPSVGI
jgi:Right handed beta helix region